MQVSILLKGRLRGMGREALCDVMAKKNSSFTKASEGYAISRIMDAPDDLPDGDYVLHVDSRMLSVRRRKREWLLGNELLTEHKLSHPSSFHILTDSPRAPVCSRGARALREANRKSLMFGGVVAAGIAAAQISARSQTHFTCTAESP